ncbi:GntR family transcriptional regulator [uncultured Cohaesibacter sp.]|uniref:GntR family transcriptional regulator n=1 Tax=uncultured Cohaesibacter sp. TaxID=1002546 RepID=UPI00292F24FF|nr:GntR family transcriptional regulator [uncultured Cohaesibacter sp.]
MPFDPLFDTAHTNEMNAVKNDNSSEPPKKKRITLVDRARLHLRDEILSGRLAPGQRIHLNETAEQLEMSMVPLREALGSLVSEGLVTAVRQRGFRVSEVDLDDMADIYRLRLILDPLAVELAVSQMTDQEFDAVTEAYQAIKGAKTKEISRADNRTFHFSVYTPCRSPWLLRIINMLWENSERYQTLSTSDKIVKKHHIDEHEKIYRAIVERDPKKAAEAMYQHVKATAEALVSAFDEKDPS